MSAALVHSHVTAPLSVTHSADVDAHEWDGFVEAHDAGTMFHLSGWGEVSRAAYGYEPVYITARRDGNLAGVLMLTDVRSPLLGRSLISTAFTVGGGPLADDDAAFSGLLEAAFVIGEERGVRYIECRSDCAADQNRWVAKTGVYAGFTMAIPEDEADNLQAVPRKRRAEIRKSLAAAAAGELSVRHDADIDEFYALYARALKVHGTPVFPKKFLHALVDIFKHRLEIAAVDYRGAPAACLLSFYFRDVVLPYYVGASADARALRAYDYLYWSLMRHAAGRGCRRLDFGRSKIGEGSYQYKKLWGGEPTPLTYGVRLIGASDMPNVNPNNPKFSLFAKTWPYLPLSVANRLGPLLAPNFP